MNAERAVDGVLGALWLVQGRLAEWKSHTADENASWRVWVSPNQGAYAIEACASATDSEGVATETTVTCWRKGDGWEIDRSVYRTKPGGSPAEEEWAEVACTDSAELASLLPRLVSELIDSDADAGR